MCDSEKTDYENCESILNDSSNSSSVENITTKKTDEKDVLRQIIEKHFDEEIAYKKLELNAIDERIFSTQNLLDKLRVCIICKFYSSEGKLNVDEYKNHPIVRQLDYEQIEAVFAKDPQQKDMTSNDDSASRSRSLITTDSQTPGSISLNSQLPNLDLSDVRINVGNVSKYLKSAASGDCCPEKIEASQYDQDLITHKWMVYIRSPNCKNLENYIKKVIFYLHPSYKPYDIVQVKSAPFQLIKRGWGEFPIHAQIHFKDPRNKRVDINHLLKLDWTQTGLQTFGGETGKECQLAIKPNDFIGTAVKSTSLNKQLLDQFNTAQSDVPNNNNMISNYDNQYEAPKNNTYDSCDQIGLKQSQVQSNKWHYENQQMSPRDSNCFQMDTNHSKQANFPNPSGSSLTTIQTNQEINSSRFDLSPSDFISTGILENPEERDPKKEIPKTNFDDLISNFYLLNDNEKAFKCTNNENNLQQSSNIVKAKTDEFIPNNVTEEKSRTHQKSVSKTVSLDALLNLRPKSIVSIIQPASVKAMPPGLSKSEEHHQSIGNPVLAKVSSVIRTTQLNVNSGLLTNQLKPPIISTRKIVVPNNFREALSEMSVKETFAISMPQSISNDKNSVRTSIAPEGQSVTSHRKVIYKVDSSDALNTNRNIFKASIGDFPKPIFEIDTSNTYKLKNNQLLTNPCEFVTINKKKLKISPNQLTKVKSSNSNNDTSPESSICQVNHENNTIGQNPNHNISVEDGMLASGSFQSNIYSMENLCSQLIKKPLPFTFESCVKTAMKHFPIVLSESARILKHELPFCATSIKEFYSWSYAKRRANEWMRAVAIKNKCIELTREYNSLIDTSVIPNDEHLTDVTFSTKKIVLWLRSHGYTPLEFQHMISVKNKAQYSILSQSYINSFSPISRLDFFTRLQSLKETESKNEGNDLIDVVGVSESFGPASVKPQTCTELTRTNVNQLKMKTFPEEQIKHIELCEGGKYVKEQLDLLNIKTNRVILQRDENCGERTKYSCDLVERLMFFVCKRFADDLIRRSCAGIYFEPAKSTQETLTRKKNDSSPNDQHMILNQSFPCFLSVAQVFATMNNHSIYQFLTNKYMAIDDRKIGVNETNSLDGKLNDSETNVSKSNTLVNNPNLTNKYQNNMNECDLLNKRNRFKTNKACDGEKKQRK